MSEAEWGFHSGGNLGVRRGKVTLRKCEGLPSGEGMSTLELFTWKPTLFLSGFMASAKIG